MKIDNQKLDLVMARNCLSSEKLSEITGVSQVTIARIKNGVSASLKWPKADGIACPELAGYNDHITAKEKGCLRCA
ncbi:hypothetical protein L9W92_18575 [Pelotomaculum terephthalicicum JT]|uniref:helix-turn-helix domain-containing protein n=1 Tax=Pelotomaculum terephthalicicum TaxID=206393 RepID=UPI001F03A244|nr:hypothetical protein [Pelotomaculum terephthalicicum]MCG9969995.1 hypothetical protein [Pelotomaculum terephthalicicum JT]